jgi:hypothetical protein
VKPIDLDPLSKRARAIAGTWFGMGRNSSVTHHLRELKPTAEAQSAIAELLEAGVMSREAHHGGGFTYRPLVDCMSAFLWVGQNIDDPEVDFRVMEPV